MVHYRYPSGRRIRRKNRRGFFLTTALVAISLSPVAFYANLQGEGAAPVIEAPKSVASPASAQATETTVHETKTYDLALVDPNPVLSPETLNFSRNAPLATTFAPFSKPQVARAEPPVEQADSQPVPEMTLAQAVQPIPLPVPRPAEFRISKPVEVAQAARPITRASVSQPVQSAMAPSAPANSPSFFEKLFGIKPATPPESALSYAALDSGNAALSTRPNSASPAIGAGTAVYNISEKVVIMPNGERLEAHSGLGDKLDDPRYVHVRMKGSTPPGTYTITEREALFHGVRALRLTPVGGSRAIHGRDGILAHTYMLGPNGDSNGCVSFRNYDRFLQAYLRGEVKRLVVVAGYKQDLLPRIVNNRPQRSARDT